MKQLEQSVNDYQHTRTSVSAKDLQVTLGTYIAFTNSTTV